MLQERFRRWRRNAGFWLLVLIMLIVLLVAVYTYKGYRNAATELVLERDEQLVVLSAARLREELGNLSENLEVLARSRDLSSGDPARQREAIEEAAPRLAIFDGGVLLLDEKGLVLLSYPERGDLNGEDLSDQALFQGVFDENLLFVSDVQRMGMDGQQVVMIGVPIQGDEGQFSGALVGMFELGADSLSAFYASIVRLRLGQSGTTYIADSSGRILYDSGSGRIGRSLTVEQLSILDEDGGPEALLTVDEHGNQIVAAFAPVPGTPWELIIEDDWAILTQSTRRFSNVLLLSFGVAMVLPPLSLAILSRQRRFRILADSLPQREEHIVRVLRRELHPQQLPVLPGWDLLFKQHTGKEGGHDFFDSIITPDGRLLLVVGRVEVGGVEGALALVTTRSMLRSSGLQMVDPGEALERCNKLLCAERAEAFAVRSLYMLLEPSTGRLCYANAGQPTFFIAGSELRIENQVRDQAMGTSMETGYKSAELHIGSGESLVILGPGMMEAINTSNQSFREQAADILRRGHLDNAAMAENLLVEFERFAGRVNDNDKSVLILRRIE
ncbi:MAG: SpoIIE family protein phosphatase [Anaerolineales bacterium]|jgi:hypothetical protein